MPAPMFEGKAVGGPRDGVKLTASYTWDGVIMQRLAHLDNRDIPYPGKYKWSWDQYAWIWHPKQFKA